MSYTFFTDLCVESYISDFQSFQSSVATSVKEAVEEVLQVLQQLIPQVTHLSVYTDISVQRRTS